MNLWNRYRARVLHAFGLAAADPVPAPRIGWSFGLGAWLSIMPTPGFSIAVGIGLALVFRRIHKLSLGLAFVVFNPMVAVPLNAFGYQVGDLLFGQAPPIHIDLPLERVYHFTLRFLVGNALLAAVVASASAVALSQIVQARRRAKVQTAPVSSPEGDG